MSTKSNRPVATAARPPRPHKTSDRAPAFARGWSDPLMTIHCGPGDVSTEIFGKVPGGTRLHVRYKGGEITVHNTVDNRDMAGHVLSGIDWVLIRNDAVAVFDTRLTFRVDDDNDGFVFDGMIAGLVDLAPGMTPEKRQGAYASWEDLPQRTVPVALPVRFEASGPNQDWVAKQFQASAQKFTAYSYLVSNQFLAFGGVEIASRGMIQGLRFDIARLDPRERA